MGARSYTRMASAAQKIRENYPEASAEQSEFPLAPVFGASRYGHPFFDFKAAPSLFMDEDLMQEDFMLAHRHNVRHGLAASEVCEADAVAKRREAEAAAAMLSAQERNASRYAAETREVERAAVSQRAELEAKYQDAEQAAMAARARADELRSMLASAAQEQARAQAEHAQAAATSEKCAAAARESEYCAVQCRLANDNCFAERSVLEGQGARGPVISSLLGGRGGYISDASGATAASQVRARCGIRRFGHP